MKIMEHEKRLSVLVVDDEESARKLFTSFLKRRYRVFQAGSAADAMVLIEKDPPDIVITDIRMPGDDGLVLLSRIKEKFPDIFVIIATGHGEKSTLISAIREGAFDYLEKPVIHDEFLYIIKRAESYSLLQKQIKESEIKQRKNFELQKILYLLLQLYEQDLPFVELLEKSFDIIYSSSLIPFKSHGSIFVVEEEPDVLVLKTHHKLPKDLISKCSKIPFGRCLCGMAAKTKEVVFSNCVGHDHSVSFEGMEPHGHYCVPIITKNGVIGVFNIYVKDGHERNETEEKFLKAIANTLGGIIERKNMEKEKEKMQLEKLASITTISKGVAHELNNPLVSVMGYSQLMAAGKYDCEQMISRADKIYKASLRMKKIINQLRLYTGTSVNKNNLEPLMVSGPISRALNSIESKLKHKNIEVKRSFSKEDFQIYGDETDLENAFQNLLTNSYDAFRRVKDNRKKQISISTLTTQKAVSVIFQDNAVGMTDEVKNRIFDPFFTTKETGQGTGLGMSLTYNIIKNHNGTIKVESEIGVGSKFNITFK